MEQAIDMLTSISGERPLGWYTGRTSENTRKLIAENGGFLYDFYTKDEVKIAVFDYHGFDTHARQGATNGEHARQLKKLDIILSTLKDRLQEKWQNTLVVDMHLKLNSVQFTQQILPKKSSTGGRKSCRLHDHLPINTRCF